MKSPKNKIILDKNGKVSHGSLAVEARTAWPLDRGARSVDSPLGQKTEGTVPCPWTVVQGETGHLWVIK